MGQDLYRSYANIRNSLLRANIVENDRNQEKNVHRKKRKRKAFPGVQKQAKRETETTEIVSTTPSTSRDCSYSEAEIEESIGASRKKMKMQSSPNDSYSEPPEIEDTKDVFQGQGYRLIDLERFSSALSEVHVCEIFSVNFFALLKLHVS